MKKSIYLILSVIMYLISFILIGYYFSLEFNKTIIMSPISRVTILLFSCLLMYLGSLFLYKNNNKKYILKINIIIWFILYIILLSTLTLFDDYFYRNGFINFNSEIFNNYIKNSFNIIPFKTIINFIINYINSNISLSVFMYNILGNIIAFMPFAFFLPLIFKNQEKIKNFIITMIGIVIFIELLQFITLSGSCDIDDVILNVFGSYMLFKIFHIKVINKFIKNIFLLEAR